MTLLATVFAEAQTHPTFLPPIGFALIAFTVFLTLGVIAWTYRDVANRHSQKFTKGSTDHHDAGH